MNKFLLIGLLIISGETNSAVICSTQKSTTPVLESVYKSGPFRVFYTKNLQSTDRLANMQDINNNGVPDTVENVAIQANTTIEALSYLGFTSPFESARYKGTVDYIVIHLQKLNGNGLAYENPSRYINIPNKENKCGLYIAINSSIDYPGNYYTVVNHEIFHLYQYGYNQFKDAWYHESMANLMEGIFKVREQSLSKTVELPNDTYKLQNNIYSVGYNTLWNRLSVLADKSDGQLNLPQEILNRKYVDGSKVFKDEKLKGYVFIKKTLENLKLKSDQVSVERGWNMHNWSEANQVSSANRPYILKAIQETMLQFGMNKSQEEKDFLNLN